MSLWTPGGEHEVPRESPSPTPGRGPDGPNLDVEDDEDRLANLSPEERQRATEMAAEMDDVRRQVAEVPAALVVANHAMGLYELGAIHLSQDPPNFDDARLAIDGLGALVEGLQGRLGENELTLRDALGQLRLAFVQLRGKVEAGAGTGPTTGNGVETDDVDFDEDDDDDVDVDD
jgi:Domain of unknown function (DUF1844)